MRGMFCLCVHLAIILNTIAFVITMLLLSLNEVEEAGDEK